jgi:hypothetical protein
LASERESTVVARNRTKGVARCPRRDGGEAGAQIGFVSGKADPVFTAVVGLRRWRAGANEKQAGRPLRSQTFDARELLRPTNKYDVDGIGRIRATN